MSRFVVIFCNTIKTGDQKGLESLCEFVGSLESCRTISEGADKLYKMCSIFTRVAKIYIQARAQDAAMRAQTSTPAPASYCSPSAVSESQLDVNTMASFDPYLSALGLIPNASWSMASYSDPSVTTSMDATAFGQGGQGFGAALGADVSGLGPGFGLPAGGQNAVMDWFSGSRYLMNVMEPGGDLQMPDLDL